ncbi:uncharacterized protein RHO25_004057 [Cercospora beticola]|uniref:Uncharacterized protein n=1 Tax=Cercospora beticola TaxID=122368 RepID=A0ABZ0NIX3_CERBT|nr:hypothetical protein RHO25_004057 [Cercospora beticola]
MPSNGHIPCGHDVLNEDSYDYCTVFHESNYYHTAVNCDKLYNTPGNKLDDVYILVGDKQYKQLQKRNKHDEQDKLNQRDEQNKHDEDEHNKHD